MYDRAKFCEASGVPLTSIDAALVREYEVWRNERMPLSNWLMWLVVSTNTACLVFSADLRLCCAALLKLSTASMTKQCRAHLGLHLNETVFTVDLWNQL